MTDQEYMSIAINMAKKGHTPYGCVIVDIDSGQYIADHNKTKIKTKVAHAEIEALLRLDELPSQGNYVLYTTAEPCPMCMSAILWSGIAKVVFGVPISIISKYHKQIQISSEEVVAKSWSDIQIVPRVSVEDCLALFKEYSSILK